MAEISPNCPRCGSSSTKFCYYNNYSLTQPRYFCKACRRYWTKGGSLRNVPVGGGCRKTRRSSRSLTLSKNSQTLYSSVEKSSSSSSMSSDGSHIDLALVYANFLDQKPPDCHKTTFNDMPGFPCHFGQFPTISNPSSVTGPSFLLPAEDQNGAFSDLSMEKYCLGNNVHDQTCLFGLESSLKQTHYKGYMDACDIGLQKVLGQDVLASDHLTMENHELQNTTSNLDLIGLQENDEDPNLLIDNWSSFDLSNDDMTLSSRHKHM